MQLLCVSTRWQSQPGRRCRSLWLTLSRKDRGWGFYRFLEEGWDSIVVLPVSGEKDQVEAAGRQSGGGEGRDNKKSAESLEWEGRINLILS